MFIYPFLDTIFSFFLPNFSTVALIRIFCFVILISRKYSTSIANLIRNERTNYGYIIKNTRFAQVLVVCLSAR